MRILGYLLAALLATAPALAETVKLPNGGTINYAKVGGGPVPVVFLHGYSFDASVWERVTSMMPVRYTAYAYDLRGFGRSDKPAAGYSYAQMAEDLGQFLDALKLERAALVGHSLGAMVAQEYATLVPQRVSALVLSNGQARHLPPPGLTAPIQARIDSFGTPEQNRAVFQQTTPRYFATANLQQGDLERLIQVNMQSATPALKQVLAEVFTAEALPPERFQRLTMPALIVASTLDIVPWSVPVALSEALPNARIFVVERAGHTPMWERPRRWAEGVFAFLDGIKG
ncbi:MAG: alpha/beta fold hydrolase [Thalassobaculales bacterium]